MCTYFISTFLHNNESTRYYLNAFYKAISILRKRYLYFIEVLILTLVSLLIDLTVHLQTPNSMLPSTFSNKFGGGNRLITFTDEHHSLFNF